MRRRRRVPRRRALRLPPSVRSAAVGSHNRYRARAASGSLRTGFWSHAPTPVPVSVNLAPGPQVEFLCPGAALLMVQRPVSLRDGVDVQQAVRATLIGQIGHLRQKPFARNPAVDHDMRDMDPFGSDLPGQRLRTIAQRALGGADCREPDRKSVVSGKSVSVRVELGGRGSMKKKNKTKRTRNN